jgi:lysozyme family protein
MIAFDKAFARTVGLEGGYSDHPADKRGPTMYGITEAVARENGYTGPMQDLSLETAKQIYKSQYWDKMSLDNLEKMSESIAIELFDTAVNMGTGIAVRFLQRALNCFHTKILKVDGIMGAETISNLYSCYDEEKTIILKMLNAQQCVRYMEIVEVNPSQAVFLKGWINNRVS